MSSARVKFDHVLSPPSCWSAHRSHPDSNGGLAMWFVLVFSLLLHAVDQATDVFAALLFYAEGRVREFIKLFLLNKSLKKLFLLNK
jgi:hypothetical protein